MKLHLSQLVAGKKVLILGFGREGKSTYSLLREAGSYSELAVSDIRPVELSDSHVRTISGDGYLDVLDDYDIVFKSPGIVLPKDISEYTCHVTSQTEQFLLRYSQKVVGITGTKGKSTTSSLLYHVLKESGRDCILAGNIGIPVFDIVHEITPETVIVLEMSCHQLEYIHTAPGIGVFLNLFEDHLDHYGTFERYSYIKQNIYRNQKPSDILFCNPDFMPAKGDCVSEIRTVSADVLPIGTAKATKLKGEHNLFNIAVVYEICRLFGVDESAFLAALPTFSPLAHRLEHVGCIDGIDYYDDSISTTAESTISAVTSIANAGSLLVGGMDRGIDYTGLIEFLAGCSLDEVIFMYESGKRIYDRLCEITSGKDAPHFVYVPDLASAVEYARTATPKGKACILSPAAASYGYFKNFEHRGDEFCRMVLGK